MHLSSIEYNGTLTYNPTAKKWFLTILDAHTKLPLYITAL